MNGTGNGNVQTREIRRKKECACALKGPTIFLSALKLSHLTDSYFVNIIPVFE